MRRSELMKKQLITAEHHDWYSDSDNTMQVQGRKKKTDSDLNNHSEKKSIPTTKSFT